MSYASIVGMLIPGSPETRNDVTGAYLVYTYKGVTATLLSNAPAYNDLWGPSDEYIVRSVSGPDRLEMSTHSIMVVEVATFNLSGSGEITNSEWPIYEIDFVPVEKPLLAHPQFAAFTDAERVACRLWIEEVSSIDRAAFKYWHRDKDGETTGTVNTLTTDQQEFAKMWLQGIESYVDYNPVARKTQLYKGSDQPTVSDIGTKTGGDPFATVPSGYEWIQTGDGARKQGSGFTWTRVNEWKGARKIAVDVDTVYP